MTSSYFKLVLLFFQMCQFMYHEFDVDQNFLGTAMHFFLMEVISLTSYIGSFQNEERSRVQICIFKGFIYLYLMLAALQTLLFTSMFDSAMHAFEAFLCMRIMPTLSFCQNMGN